MTPDQLKPWLRDSNRAPLVMGVLNVTPDSFSDGGLFSDPPAAAAQAESMVAAGADWIDIGAESTRPGAQRITAEVQISRLAPVLQALRLRVPTVLSIDTTLSAVAEMAIDAGIDLVNDISAGRDDAGMLPLVARRGVPIILMHMQGEPATMQAAPAYEDVVAEVRTFLSNRMTAAMDAGIAADSILVDPGIGFGKNTSHNLDLLRQLKVLADLDRPLVVGASRKRFIAQVTADPTPERLFGTAATVAWAVTNHAAVVRVHDVGPMSQVVRMIRAIQTGWPAFLPEAGSGSRQTDI